jgi:DNA-binding NarL/FixJ family response regulator
MSIRVLIIDSQPLIRLGLKSAIAGVDDIQLVGEASTGTEGLASFATTRSDVIILSQRLPDMCAADDLDKFFSIDPAAKILIIAEHSGDAEITRVLECGAIGYVTSEVDPDQLIPAIRNVAAGKEFLGEDIKAKLASDVVSEKLTSAETVVLRMLVGGMSNKEIAFTLDVSDNTIKTHVKHIFEKMGVSDRTTATITAIKRGLVRVDV